MICEHLKKTINEFICEHNGVAPRFIYLGVEERIELTRELIGIQEPNETYYSEFFMGVRVIAVFESHHIGVGR